MAWIKISETDKLQISGLARISETDTSIIATLTSGETVLLVTVPNDQQKQTRMTAYRQKIDAALTSGVGMVDLTSDPIKEIEEQHRWNEERRRETEEQEEYLQQFEPPY